MVRCFACLRNPPPAPLTPRPGLEQLLINFANESLQRTFNAQVFEAELQVRVAGCYYLL